MLTREQKQIIDDLRDEVKTLSARANEANSELWAKLRNGGDWDDDKYNEVFALDGERMMKELIAHVPSAGEQKVSKIRKQIAKLLDKGDGRSLRLAGDYQARLDALDSVNAWRDSMGLPLLDRLPRGINGDSQECTLAKALKYEFNGNRDLMGVSVGGETAEITWTDKVTGYNHSASPGIESQSTVVSRFDDDTYVDLIAHHRLCELIVAVDFGRFWNELVRRANDPYDSDRAISARVVEDFIGALNDPNRNYAYVGRAHDDSELYLPNVRNSYEFDPETNVASVRAGRSSVY